MAPGETHIVRRSHLCALRDPCELVGFGIPLSLGGDGGATKHCGATVIEGNGVVGKPGAKGLAALGGDSLRETAFELKEEEDARGKGWLVDRAGGGVGELGERVKTRSSLARSSLARSSLARSGNGYRIALRGQRADRDGADEKAEQGMAVHDEYAISRKVGSLKRASLWRLIFFAAKVKDEL